MDTPSVQTETVNMNTEGVATFDDFDSENELKDENDDSESSGNSGKYDPFEDDLPDDAKAESRLLDSKEKQDAKAKKEKKDSKDGDEDDEENNEDDEDSDSDHDPDDSSEDDKNKEAYKNVKKSRGKFNDDNIDVPDDTTFAVTIDGKKEFVSLNDLKSNFSGKVSYEKKFQDIKRDNLKIKAEKEDMESDRAELMERVSDIKNFISGAMKGEVSPFAAVEYFCNLTGVSAFDYNKKMIDHYIPVIEHLIDATDSEKNAYFAMLENSYLKNNQAATSKLNEAKESLKEQDASFSKKLESLGVGKEDFSIARQELKEMNKDASNPDKVLKYIHFKNLFSIAGEASEKMKNLFSKPEEFDEFNKDLVLHMDANPELATLESLTKFIDETFELPEKIVDDFVKEVKQSNKKQESKKKINKNKKFSSEDEIMTFNDLDW